MTHKILKWAEMSRPIVCLAPMDGITDSAYRRTVRQFNRDAVMFSEFTSADGFLRSKRLQQRLDFHAEEHPYFVQLFGNNPETFAETARILEQQGVAGVDINMGCPSKKIVHSQHGSGLMRDVDQACRIVEAVAEACQKHGGFYLGSIGVRTLLRGRPITPFEVTQAGAALLVGFSGAVRVITVSGAVPNSSQEISVTLLPNLYRFKAGGSHSVRGYGFEDLTNNGIGSNHIITASAEVEFMFRQDWSVATFFDIGNAFNDWDNRDLKRGIGAGLRWYSIAGPVRLDFAQALDFDGQPWRIHFTIGIPLL